MINEYVEPGTMIKSKVGGIKGMIVEILIDFSNIPRYKILYFSNGVDCEVVMHEQQFDIEEDEKKKAGFQK